MDEITIDRLVLDIPGLTPGQAKDLAAHVGAGLAAAPKSSALGDVNFDALSINLNDRVPTSNLPRLADAIVNALLRQMGRS
jgi:hypothetical protein